MAFIGYGLIRQQMVDRAITHGSFSRADDKVIAALAATGMLLGVLLLVLVAAD